MNKFVFALVPVMAACVPLQDLKSPADRGRDIETAEVSAPPPPTNARTVDQFDTTTSDQREAAASSSGGALLGTVTATLGDPASPGFWIETGLVRDTSQGRLRYPETGRSVSVELRPLPGGSARVSLAAMRLLEAPLGDLAVIEVYRK